MKTSRIRSTAALALLASAMLLPALSGRAVADRSPMAGTATTSFDFLWWGQMTLGAGLMDVEAAAARMAAAKAVYDGESTPTASYKPSPKIDAFVTEKFVDDFTHGGDYPGGRPAAEQYVKARLADYEQDATAHGDPPNDFASACAYFASTAIAVQNDRPVGDADRRAIRGACVMETAEFQANKKLTGDEQRQTLSDAIVVIASSVADQYRQERSTSGRAALKATMAKTFSTLFGIALEGYPVDHIACAGANDAASRNACQPVSNAKMATLATRER